MVKYSNVFLCNKIGKIGGVETFLYEIGKKYGIWDITVVYNEADLNQVKRISKYVRCVRLTEPIHCEKCFMNYQAPRERVIADEYIALVHANYEVENRDVLPGCNEYYGVSNWVSEAYERLLKKQGCDKEVKTCYNPITYEKPNKALFLVSATRLSKEKGKDRMIKLANMLTEANIPFIWLVFTNDLDRIDNPNVFYMKPTISVRDYMARADYVVQLSDTEGCPYTPMEANLLGVPCIYTPVESMIEIGIQGYQVPFDMNFDVKKLLDIPKVDWKPPKDIWDTILVKKKSTYTPDEMVEVEALKTYEYKGQWTTKGYRNLITKEDYEVLKKEGKVKEWKS